MRANRLLGAALVEHNLVKIEDLEKANEKLLEIVAAIAKRPPEHGAGVLAYDMKVMQEEDVLAIVDEPRAPGWSTCATTKCRTTS
jgi:hypothetical protein